MVQLEKVLIPDLQKVSGETEAKICAVGMTKLLTETPEYVKVTLRSFDFGAISF